MTILKQNLKKILNFVTAAESDLLVKEVDFKLKKVKSYQVGHFDNVITNYKEAAPTHFSPAFQNILNRMKSTVIRELDLRDDINVNVHILDLACENSGIGAHTDHHTGRFVAGLCLLSPAVMIFRRGGEAHRVLLEENCFYLQHGRLRYEYTHEIPKQESIEHSIHGYTVARKRRVTVLLREQQIVN